ncbi:hypothetical protein FRC04_001106 [Tulasnella sp. 424]|nr:hypothetical protein FRC04_001106 [Tulasnella sp. 424]
MRADTFTCACKARFTVDSSGYTNHISKCSRYKDAQVSTSRNLLEALQRRKKRKAEAVEQRRFQSQLESASQVHRPVCFAHPVADTADSQEIQPAPTSQDARAFQTDRLERRSSCLSTRFQRLLPEIQSVLAPRWTADRLDESLSLATVGGTSRAAEEQLQSATRAGSDDDPVDGSEQATSTFQTLRNAFGIFRTYLRKPARIPDQEVGVAQLTDGICEASDPPLPSFQPQVASNHPTDPPSGLDLAKDVSQSIHPFPNISTFRLAHWYHTSGMTGSQESLSRLVKEVLLSEDFKADQLDKQSVEKFDRLLDKMDKEESGRDAVGVAEGSSWDGWIEEGVRIEVPTGVKNSHRPRGERASHAFEVKGLHRRKLVDVIQATFESPAAADFHFDPFTTSWELPSWIPPFDDCTGNTTTTRIHDELYTSDAWLEEQAKIDALTDVPDDLPRAIAGMMFWSDATHLTQFGTAKMWPLYLYFGNQSKIARGKPSSRASHHVAYIPSLPDTFHDIVRTFNKGKTVSQDLLQHCKRELFQAVWNAMMDPEFLEAYRHGIVVQCGDGITRRLFPRIFTYSADYPEKVLIATIRNLGNCPCPLCLVHRDNIHLLGTTQDQQTRSDQERIDDEDRRRRVTLARNIIYQQGYAPGNEHSENFLKKDSLVATENAFSVKLAETFGFNFFTILTVDLLHEFELGVWKAVFTHLVRLLYALGQTVVDRFNERFRKIGNFGRATIRSFAFMNVTDMKNWAARTYEDCLQLLESTTERLGDELRAFETYTGTFETYETPKEAAARQRRAVGHAGRGKQNNRTDGEGPSRRRKRFSLRTIKIHLLGHYVPTIRRFGTTDSYSTQIGELEHHTVKAFYRRTNKQDYIKQTTRLYRRQERIRAITENVRRLGVSVGKKMKAIDRSESTPLPPTQPTLSYQIAESSRHWVHLGDLMRENPNEPALRNFIENLKNHIIGRLRSRPFDGEETDYGASERDNLVIKDNVLHQHAYLRINYTTYDVRRDQDIINPRVPSRSFVMVPAGAGDHPYWYARVLGIFDLQVSPSRQQPAPVKLHFLWVRWLGEDPGHVGDFQSASHCRVGYVRFGDSNDAFGFLDPSVIIRACHLIPAFRFGYTKDLLPTSEFYDDPDHGDFVNYYVNQFVDRDMLMRFIGCGVGHVGMVDEEYAHTAIQQLLHIQSSSRTAETLEAVTSLPAGRRGLAGDEEVIFESDDEEHDSDPASDEDNDMDMDDDDGDCSSLDDHDC